MHTPLPGGISHGGLSVEEMIIPFIEVCTLDRI